MRRMQRTLWRGTAAPIFPLRVWPRAALVGAVSALWLVGCSLMPQNSADLRIDEVQRALLPMARVALDTGQMETAKRLYQRLLDVDPDSFDARMGLGNVAFKDRRSADAVRWYLSALVHAGTASERHDALLWHGRSALDDGQLQAARRSFQLLVDERESAPATSVAWALNGIGLTRLLDGDILGAIEAMEQAVQQAGDEKMFADNLERALNMLAELRAEGAEDGSRAATITPTASEVLPETAQPAARTDVAATETAVVAPPPAVDRAEQPRASTLPTATAAESPPAAASEPATDEGAVELGATSDPAPAQDVQAEMEAAEPDSQFAAVDETAATNGAEEAPEQMTVADQTAEESAPVDNGPGETPAPDQQGQQGDETAAATPSAINPAAVAEPEPAEPPPPAVPLIAPPPPTEAGYVLQSEDGPLVQMGAFAVRSTAESLAEVVGAATDATIEVVESNDLYRVLIGPLASEAALDVLAEDLGRHGYRIAREPAQAASATAGFDASAVPRRGFVLVEDGQRFLQLGAFEARDSADDLAFELADVTGQAVTVAESWRDDVAVYRVRIGPLASDDALAEMVAALASAGYEID